MPHLVTDTPPRTRPETVIGGRYKTLRVVGRGGMGTVYEAVHTWTGRRVALKVLLPHAVADERAVERFRREARAGVQGAHRNIVEVLDMGVDPADGTLFLAQEFLTGEDLAARLARDGRLPLRVAFELLIPAMAALDVAHRAGVVHRDVKPANLFLSGPPDAIVTKVIDFGIAAIADAEAVTRTGAPLGTPQYMAPEQAHAARDLDLRVDVWSMGAVWFEALTGRRPIDGASYHEVMARLLAGSPPRVESAAPELPADVRAAIDGALEPNRSRRHASMAAFAHALLSATTLAPEPWLRALADEHRFAEAPAIAPRTDAPPAAAPVTLDLPPSSVAAREAPAVAPAPPPEPPPTLSSMLRPRWPLVAVGLVAAGLVATGAWRSRGPQRPRSAAAETSAAPVARPPDPIASPTVTRPAEVAADAPPIVAAIIAASPRRPPHARPPPTQRAAAAAPDINGAPVLEP